jgi:hypothetical protein
MKPSLQVFGEYGLYDRDVTIIRDVGGQFKVVNLKSVRKSGLIDDRPHVVRGSRYDGNKCEQAVSRSKKVVKEYALCNDFDWFVTLTIDKEKYDRYNLKGYYKDLGELLHNYNGNCTEAEKVRYILIPELHQDGAWHMHGLVKGIKQKDLYINEHGYWSWRQYDRKFGFMSMGKIKDKLAVGNYITKYISKDMGNTVNELNAKMYYCSKGLKKGENVYRGHDVEVNCDWDFERKDGFCKVKWFPDADAMANTVSILQSIGAVEI